MITTPRDDGTVHDAMIDTPAWITEILGDPLTIEPVETSEDTSDSRSGWDHDPALLAAIRIHANDPEITMIERENTCNYESDLSADFVYTVYARDDGSEWYYQPNAYIAITEHLGGDPRGNYGSTSVYRADHVGERGFFDRRIGWYLDDPTTDELLEDETDQCAVGYSNNPTLHLDGLLDDAGTVEGRRRPTNRDVLEHGVSSETCERLSTPTTKKQWETSGEWVNGAYHGVISGKLVRCTPYVSVGL